MWREGQRDLELRPRRKRAVEVKEHTPSAHVKRFRLEISVWELHYRGHIPIAGAAYTTHNIAVLARSRGF